jgi:hypothetical protein
MIPNREVLATFKSQILHCVSDFGIFFEMLMIIGIINASQKKIPFNLPIEWDLNVAERGGFEPPVP